MEAWWATLNETLRWFYATAISASALVILQLVLMMLGLDADYIDDASGAGDGKLQILSVRTVTAFFAGFGWTGIAALQSGASLLRSLAYASGVGTLFMGGVVLLMRGLYGMRHSGSIDGPSSD